MFAVVVSMIGVSALWSYLIDPYQVFASNPEYEGFNLDKQFLGQNIRLYYAADLLNNRFDTLILGASTAEGLPLNHPFYLGQSTYRLAIAGANGYELRRYFQHASRRNNIQHLVLLLDFYSFNRHRKPTADFREDILDVSPDGSDNHFAALHRLSHIVSIDTVLDALATPLNQRAIDRRDSADDHGGILARDYRVSTPLRDIVNQIDRYQLERGLLPPPTRSYALDGAPGEISPIENVAIIADAVAGEGQRLDVIISPSHARALATFEVAGLWSTFEEFKRRLAIIAENRPAMHVWDFSGFHAYASESVPEAGVLEPMEWYRDQIHITPKLGRLVLDEIHSGPMLIGVRLTSSTIDAHLSMLRGGLEHWKNQFPGEYAEVLALGRLTGARDNAKVETE